RLDRSRFIATHSDFHVRHHKVLLTRVAGNKKGNMVDEAAQRQLNRLCYCLSQPIQELASSRYTKHQQIGDIFHPSLSLDLFSARAGQIAGVGFFLGFFASLFFFC
ncbi:MAG: hypothetical protein ACREUM_00980, partial [Nitrosospira sp.]